MSYVDEFVIVGTIALLGAMSPGPDFIITTQNSLQYGRKAGILTALGISLGCGVHITYILFAVDLVAEYSQHLFSAIKYLGAAYLIYLGFKGLLAKKDGMNSKIKIDQTESYHAMAAFKQGLWVNLLNPKVILFFMSMFTMVIDRNTPRYIQALYGIEFCLIAFAWFSVLTLILNYPVLKKKLLSVQHIIERCFGAVLIIFGIKIATLSHGA